MTTVNSSSASRFLVLVLLWTLAATPLLAQNYTQTVKGVVLDKAVRTPLIGATVVLLESDPPKGAQTDAEGRFHISQVPIGKRTLVVRYLGYKEMVVSNITVNSGKEVDLVLEMEEDILRGIEVVVTAKADKHKPLNELSTVSTRTFSVEETQRFAAAVNDPGRMVSAYAGVVTASDGNNTIVIRGNAPNGLLWRMEGVDIPNPNHFSAVGSSGGGISILSAQLLSNSDFSTGAFAAEYGNALSGVFDLRLRQGNRDKYEFTLQAGVLGLDAAAEGPVRMGTETGSFLANYRYSTLSVLSKIGVPIGDGNTDFQDLSFNVVMPAGQFGRFNLFGLGGLSSQTYKAVADSLIWQEDEQKQFDSKYVANTGVMGLSHQKAWDRTFLKTVLVASGTQNSYVEDEYRFDYSRQRNYDQDYAQNRLTLSSVLSHKVNPRHYLRAGAYANLLGFNFSQFAWDDTREFLEEQVKHNGRTQTVNAFAQWQWKPTERWTFNTGVHTLALLLNGRVSVEPRLAARFALSEKSGLSLGYGLHSQIQPLGIYFVKSPDGKLPNRDLGMTRAHHLVLSFDQNLPGNMRLKSEVYYQRLFDVPVNRDTLTSFSMLNNYDGFVYETLGNDGLGRNYGVELTLEKFLTNGFYFLMSGSLYDSEYRGSDKRWRNTRFNGTYAANLVAGKEWDITKGHKSRTFGLNLKTTLTGGHLETPVDLEASREKGETVVDENRAFEEKMPDYFRIDFGLRFKRNYPALTTTLSLDLQNATNRSNVFGRYYDKKSGEIKYSYQAPLIPVLAYKLEF